VTEIAVPDLLSTLRRLGAATETSLSLPADITYERYEALGVALSRAQDTVTWLIADWINFGHRVFGEKYAQAAEETKLRPETLMNYASVANRVPAERRRPELKFGHHAEVASLPPDEQVEWLDRAVVNDWRRDDLRSHLRPKELTPALGPGLEEAARDLVRSARVMGDGYLVGRMSFRQLCVALGEEP
jgi:hypothetical protein